MELEGECDGEKALIMVIVLIKGIQKIIFIRRSPT